MDGSDKPQSVKNVWNERKVYQVLQVGMDDLWNFWKNWRAVDAGKWKKIIVLKEQKLSSQTAGVVWKVCYGICFWDKSLGDKNWWFILELFQEVHIRATLQTATTGQRVFKATTVLVDLEEEGFRRGEAWPMLLIREMVDMFALVQEGMLDVAVSDVFFFFCGSDIVLYLMVWRYDKPVD